ncbi:MAG: DUF86 domain-containing protein [Mobilicoccus sp.]|nr:DUF86 domain-containing protein [Mobilicoccus sp.]
MSPRAFSADVIATRLAMMSELLEDLDALGDVSQTRLVEDRFTRHVLERVLCRLVDIAVDINTHAATSLGTGPGVRTVTEYRESFAAAATVGLIDADLAASLAPSVGLRNVLVHEYLRVDLGVLADAAPLARDGYGRYVSSVATWLRDRR